MRIGRGTNFYFDDWAWIASRRSGFHAMLASYNEHLVFVPVALYQVLLRTVGLGDYWVFRMFEALVHLACAAALFEFMRRRIGALALILVLPFVVLGKGWEYVLLPVNFGFVASLALGICARLLLERGDRLGDVSACALLVVATGCSEFAAVFSIGIAVELWLTERSFRRAWVWAMPLILYAAWWLGFFTMMPSRHTQLAAVPWFAANLAANAIGGLSGLNIFWGRLLLVLATVLVVSHLVRERRVSPRLAGLLVTAVAFWLLVALGRADHGAYLASRYVYTGAALVMLILAEACREVRVTARGLAVAVVVTVVAVVGNANYLGDRVHYLRVAASRVSAELGALQLARATVPPTLRIDPVYAPSVFIGPYFSAIAALGSSPAEPYERIPDGPESSRLAADRVLVRAGNLRVAALFGAPRAAGAPPVVERALAGTLVTRGSCARLLPAGPGASLDLRLRSGVVALVRSAGSPVAVRARRFAAGFEAGPVATVAAGRAITLQSAADASSLQWQVRLSSAGPVEVCGG